MLWILLKRVDLVARALQTTWHAQPIVNKMKSSGEAISVQYLEDLLNLEKIECFRPVTALPCKRIEIKNDIEVQNDGNWPRSPIVPSGQVQENAADNPESFGIQQSSGNIFTENSGSNYTMLQHTEDFVEVAEEPKTRFGTNAGRSLHIGI